MKLYLVLLFGNLERLSTLKENTETLLEACRNVGLEINAEKTKYMIMSHQNSGQNHNIWGFFRTDVEEDIWTKREEDESWRKLHNDELSSSPNIVRVIKLRRMRWKGQVARMGKGRGVYRVLVGKPEGKTKA